MNFIEIDNKLINLDNVTYIEKYKYGEWHITINFSTHSRDCAVSFSFEEETKRDAEYNRIKFILLGDNNG